METLMHDARISVVPELEEPRHLTKWYCSTSTIALYCRTNVCKDIGRSLGVERPYIDLSIFHLRRNSSRSISLH